MLKGKSLSEILQNIDRRVLYLLLIVSTSLPFAFKNVIIPTQCKDPAIDFYKHIMKLPEGSTVFVQSDWTNSTRGENAGQLESLLRIIHRRKLKFVLYSLIDPQAPRVARDVIFRMNQEFIREGKRPLQKWNDWVDLEYFPDANSFLIALVQDLPKALESEEDLDTKGVSRNVMQSPVLEKVKNIQDVGLLVSISGTGIIRVLIERVGQPPKVKLAAMVTGVLGPETLNYYQAKQIYGLTVGLRGTVELETLMDKGLNWPDQSGKIAIKKIGKKKIPPLNNGTVYGRGMRYYLSLHVALTLMIIAIVLGNIGILLARKRRAN